MTLKQTYLYISNFSDRDFTFLYHFFYHVRCFFEATIVNGKVEEDSGNTILMDFGTYQERDIVLVEGLIKRLHDLNLVKNDNLNDKYVYQFTPNFEQLYKIQICVDTEDEKRLVKHHRDKSVISVAYKRGVECSLDPETGRLWIEMLKVKFARGGEKLDLLRLFFDPITQKPIHKELCFGDIFKLITGDNYENSKAGHARYVPDLVYKTNKRIKEYTGFDNLFMTEARMVFLNPKIITYSSEYSGDTDQDNN